MHRGDHQFLGRRPLADDCAQHRRYGGRGAGDGDNTPHLCIDGGGNGGSILLTREHKRICSVCLLDVVPPVLEEAVVVVGVALSIGLFDSMDAGGGASF